MRIETQRELLQRFFALRDAHSTTLAETPYRQRADVYTDPDRLAEEKLRGMTPERRMGRPPIS